MNPEVIIVDGDNTCWKSFYAMAHLSFEGRPTGAIFGTIKSVLSLVNKYHPEYLIVTWTHSNSFRKDVYPEYKAKRKEKDNNYFEQQHIVVKLLQAMGVPQGKVEGFEADDIIAEVSSVSNEFGKPTFIISSDKDLLQLVTDKVKVMRNDKLYGAEEVYDEFGCWPDQIPLWLAINGDKSDNISGVSQVGPKKLSKLFKDYGPQLKHHIFADTNPNPRDGVLQLCRENSKTIDINLKIIELKPGRANVEDNLIKVDVNQDKAIGILNAHGLNSLVVPVLEFIHATNKSK